MDLIKFYEEVIDGLIINDDDNPLYVIDKLREKHKDIPEAFRDDYINVQYGIMFYKIFHINIKVTEYKVTNRLIMDILDYLGFSISDELIRQINICKGTCCGDCPIASECPLDAVPNKLTYGDISNGC